MSARRRHTRWWLSLLIAATFEAGGITRTPGVARQATETIELRGLRQPAEMLIDRWGVPHIYANSAEDAFFVQGVNAARDRLFQIDLWRRRGLGRLAEVLGPGHVEQDAAARLFLYRGSMDKEWAAYGAEAKGIATAFVAGINSYVDSLATHPERVPIEFRLLGYSPAKWQPEDVVRIRTHGLTRNLTSEVARARTVCLTDLHNGPRYDALRVGLQPAWETRVPDGLDPCLPNDILRTFTLATQRVRFAKESLRADASTPLQIVESTPHAIESAEGSNNWVIAPWKSATGRPILANDPHRAYSTPSLRYIVHLSAPGLNVIGAGEPALPGISIGHNGTIAFGLTIFNIDQEDLYVYDINPSNPRQYRYRGGWEDMRVVDEMVDVMGGRSRKTELLFTRHGPVIHVDQGRRRAYAVRSCWLEPGMAPYFGSVSYMRSTSFAEFRRAMRHWGAPTENQVYADVRGNVGWVAGGLAPIRPNWDGLMPVPGDGRYEWAGFWSGDKLPFAYNPRNGYLTTSNEMNLPPDYPYAERKLGFEWTNASRHQRIDEVLRGLARVTIEDSMRLQNDVTSIPGRRLVTLLATLQSDDRRSRAALDLLRNWDAVERVESPEAALLEVWVTRHLPKAFLDAVLPKAAADVVGSSDIAVMLDVLENPGTRFRDDARGTATRKRDHVLLASLGAAYAEVQQLLGPNDAAWRWGDLHHSVPEHPLADTVSDLRIKLQPGPLPASGGPYTPKQSSYRSSDFRLTNGPSFRLVLDVGNWDNSRAVNYPGQSGNPGDSHYQDLVQMWLRGDYFPLLFTRTAVEGSVERRIQLIPGDR